MSRSSKFQRVRQEVESCGYSLSKSNYAVYDPLLGFVGAFDSLPDVEKWLAKVELSTMGDGEENGE